MGLDNITTERVIRPPRLVIHGGPKVGKTTLFSSMPEPILISTEEGEGILDIPSFDLVEDFSSLMNCLADLYNEDHGYRTVGIDAVDGVEQLIFKHICEEKGWDNIEAPGYGKGYRYTEPHWLDFFDLLQKLRNQKGMTICLIGHSVTKTVEDPEVGPHVYTDIALQAKGLALLERWADIIGCLEREVVATDVGDTSKRKTRTKSDTGRRILTVDTDGRQKAGNRYQLEPSYVIPLRDGYGKVRLDIAKHLGLEAKPAAKKKAARKKGGK